MIFLDASAVAKRYFPERGSSQVLELLAGAEPHCSLVLLSCELTSVLNRRFREGDMTRAVYRSVKEQMKRDAATTPTVPVDNQLIETSVRLLDSHPLKTLDALYLAGALNLQQSSHADLLFVSADRQLIRAAQAEGLKVLDPERAP